MKNNECGIYIHIPFCKSKCVYCDFLSSAQSEDVKRVYVEKLVEEIKSSGNGKRVKTVFIGGGTPSCLYPRYIERIMKAVYDTFEVDEDAEITIECNPGTVDDEKAEKYIDCGINRISFGVQSLDDHELRMLGRIHTAGDFYRSLNVVRRAGFKNISADVITAIPGQTLRSVTETLKTLIETGVNHISSYSLIVEEGTYLHDNIKKFPPLPEEDEEREMYYVTERVLECAGFEHYEISNYAKPGFKSRHNTIYWERDNYLGVGLGASSLVENVRFNNISSMKDYLKFENVRDLHENITELSLNDQMSEFMFLGLRQMKGISALRFAQLFHKDIDEVFSEEIEKNISNGLMIRDGENIFLSPKGIDLSNMVMSDFLLD